MENHGTIPRIRNSPTVESMENSCSTLSEAPKDIDHHSSPVGLHMGKVSMGMKKHRERIIFPPPNQFKKEELSSPKLLIRRNQRNMFLASGCDEYCSTKSNRIQRTASRLTSSSITMAGANIKQGLVNAGKFLQAAQYVITLTLVFSIAWFPLLIVVCADTLTTNFNDGFHKIKG